MKIYSTSGPATVTTLGEVRKYIGKEIWVWCTTRHGVGYCRFLTEASDRSQDMEVIYNFIRSESKTSWLASPISVLERSMNSMWKVYSDEIGEEYRLQINYPLATMTTQDILNIYESDELTSAQNYNPNQFTPYEGKDIWVLCDRGSYDKVYIKVLSQTINSVTYLAICEYMMPIGFPGEDINPLDRQDVEAALEGVCNTICTPKAGIRIVKPVETYTTEEIYEMLDACLDYVDPEDEDNFDEEDN